MWSWKEFVCIHGFYLEMPLVFDLNQHVEMHFRVYYSKRRYNYVKCSCKVIDTDCIALVVEQFYSRL